MDNQNTNAQSTEYEEIELLKQSEKGTIHIVQKKNGNQLFVRKVLKGQYPVYLALKNCPHLCLPRLYEVTLSDDSTTIVEEYIDGETPGHRTLTKRQFLHIIKELCSVLDFLHKREIIHRDIKPSNLILTKEGHLYLIDFDAARRVKDDLEQDTRLLGTRGYAPPEQYGFSQTDERTDIYALGVTLNQLLGNLPWKSHYKKIIRKCTDLDPNKRYQSARQVEWAFLHARQSFLCGTAAIFLLLLAVSFWINTAPRQIQQENDSRALLPSESESPTDQTVQPEMENDQLALAKMFTDDGLTILPTPANPHWDGDTGIALWGCVLSSGYEDQQRYSWKLYRRDTADAPSLDDTDYVQKGSMGGNINIDGNFQKSFSYLFQENGFYFFAVAAVGDKVTYTDSSYVMSDAFEFTGENAPPLPAPTGLNWIVSERIPSSLWTIWDNIDDYNDLDSFNVTVYDKDGKYVINNIHTRQQILSSEPVEGVSIRKRFLNDWDNAYRFTVQVYSSRPNEYSSFVLSEPIPEEYFSDWYFP